MMIQVPSRSLSERDVRLDRVSPRDLDSLSDRDIQRSFSSSGWIKLHASAFEVPAYFWRLQHLSDLQPGWDSYGARAIDRDVLDYVERILEVLGDGHRPASMPEILPTSRGGVALEWRSSRGELSLELEPSNGVAPPKTSVYFMDVVSGVEWERDLADVDETEWTVSFTRITEAA